MDACIPVTDRVMGHRRGGSSEDMSLMYNRWDVACDIIHTSRTFPDLHHSEFQRGDGEFTLRLWHLELYHNPVQRVAIKHCFHTKEELD